MDHPAPPPVALNPSASGQADPRWSMVRPGRPGIQLRPLAPDCVSDCTPLEAGECVPQVQVEQHDGLWTVLRNRLQAPPPVHENVSAPRKRDATLARRHEPLAQGFLEIVHQALRYDASPQLAYPDGPGC